MGRFYGSAPRPGPGGAGRDGSATHRLDAYSARDLSHAMDYRARAKRHTLATSSAILFFALHARVQESCEA